MKYGAVVNIIGRLLLLESAVMALPLVVSIYYRQHDFSSFIICIIITSLAGFLLSFFTRNKEKNIKIREGLAIVAFGWILVSLFGSLPMYLSGGVESFIDAFFETISGFTTTGATILADIESLPRGVLFWRSFTHWMGGMGILVFTLAILPAVGAGGFQIFKAETPGPVADRIAPRIKDTAKILYITYIAITLLEIILLLAGGMTLYEASAHTFGTVGTGGFSIKNESIGAYNSTYIHIVISLFMVIAGTNFSLYYLIFKGRWREIFKDREFRFYIGVIMASIILITINLANTLYPDLLRSLKYSAFQVSSIITTTGYTTVDFDTWPAFSRCILFILMFIGGCSGSTGGAMKNIRILVLIKLIKRETLKIFHPKAVIPVKLGNKTISSDVLGSISSFFVLYILIFIIGTVIITMEGLDLVSSASSVAATLGNIGPGFGMVGPVMNYAHFSIFSKLLLSLFMLLGRLELFTIIVLLSRKFWTDKV